MKLGTSTRAQTRYHRAAMDNESPPYWLLISVLFSSTPLTPALAMQLYRTAFDLYRRDAEVGSVDGVLVQGTVRNLRREALLGVIGGPSFEAQIETERGSGTVRFLITRQGIELMAEHETPRAMLN